MPSFNSSLSQGNLQSVANRSKKEVLLRLLTSRHCANRSPFLSKVFKERHTAARRRAQAANLVGIGFGAKETEGKLTGDIAVRVYVTRKLPKKDLLRQCRVPEFVNGLATDVISVGELRFHSRPARPGASISNVSGGGGSLGCIVTKPTDADWFLLSASHVLAPAGKTTPKEIVEPATSRGGTSPIAMLADLEPLKPGGAENLFDAAIARIIDKSQISLQIPRIGPLRADVMEPSVFQSVRKYGAATGLTLGIVVDIATESTPLRIDDDYFHFVNVIQINGCGGAFSAAGDSGALVVDAVTNQPVGLVIGGVELRSLVSPMERILKRFGAQIVPQP